MRHMTEAYLVIGENIVWTVKNSNVRCKFWQN